MDIHKLFGKDQVLIEGSSAVRKLVLNRPEKLNSLTFQMISQLLKALQAFEIDSTTKLVILKARGKAFCAGGDVVKTVEYISEHWTLALVFYRKQLMLDYLLATYRKPLVVLIHGLVMGGGAGLSMNAKFRVVTEKTELYVMDWDPAPVFAMPEASLGLFPDVGASHFLSRLPGFFGEYLGLTGARIDGNEMAACGLATHFVFSKDLVALENALSELLDPDMSNISAVINKFSQEPGLKLDTYITRLEKINRCFAGKTVEDILVSLENEVATSEADKWIEKAKKSIKAASPTSLKITLRSIREGRRTQDLAHCLIKEYTVICQITRQTDDSDFIEGSRAKLFDKDNNPKWKPPKLELITDSMVDEFFTVPEDDNDWIMLQFHRTSASTVMAKL